MASSAFTPVPPPAYSETDPTKENQSRQFIIVRDVSGSTGYYKDCPGGKSRAEYMVEILYETAQEALSIDQDGKITYCTFSSPGKHTINENIDINQFSKILAETQIGGTTFATQLFKELFAKYISDRKAGINDKWSIIVFLDGEFNDKEEFATCIAEFTKQLNTPFDIKIELIQVGNDESAKEFLQFLDDNLVSQFKAKHDIVDTKSIEWLLKYGPKNIFKEMLEEKFN